TQALMAAIPVPDPEREREKLVAPGDVPSPIDPPSGCPFHPRCPHAMTVCSEVVPPAIEVGKGHVVSCHLYGDNDE
ncbi:MAG: dipeptide/oligopeptide/nickel ABC transporter ATP-binding protein, partial [Gammaproteobacteria bacterium]|nr:dipeptide/oligopeptide/nickel ABC transporter ATP-binding protein [Gammaproteobacteria bacterium]